MLFPLALIPLAGLCFANPTTFYVRTSPAPLAAPVDPSPVGFSYVHWLIAFGGGRPISLEILTVYKGTTLDLKNGGSMLATRVRVMPL